MTTKPNTKTSTKDFILASGSAQRRELLNKVGYIPKLIQPADINEQVQKGEKPLPYIRRMALTKAKAIASIYPNENILSADTIIVAGQKIIQKSADEIAQKAVMQSLSGHTHRVISSVCLIDKTGRISQKTVTTKIVMKHLTQQEIDDYISAGEWRGVCGYKIEGRLSAFVKKIIGSYSGVIGLPLYETINMLNGAGIR